MRKKRYNKALVLTMPARGSFGIIARHNGLVVVSASLCRSGRWHGRTMQALAISRSMKLKKEIMQKHAYLDTLHLLYEISQKFNTQSYIWGGLTLDIWEGRFLRKHHDIDVLTTHLQSLLPAFEESFGEAGYETRRLENGDLKVVTPDVKLHLGHIHDVDGMVEWTHNGTNGSLMFPQHWLNPRPFQFYTCTVMTVMPEFEYVLKMHPELMNPAWMPREKDLVARDALTALLAQQGTTTDGLSRHMKEVFPENGSEAASALAP